MRPRHEEAQLRLKAREATLGFFVRWWRRTGHGVGAAREGGAFRLLTAAWILLRILLQSCGAELRYPLGLIRASVFG